MIEKSKTFKRLGSSVGIKAERKTQRGIIARIFLKRLDKREAKEFVESVRKITFKDIPVKQNGKVVTWL